MRPRCVPTCRGRTYSGQLTSIPTRNDPSSRTPLHCGATPAMPGRLQQCMELMRGSFDQPGVCSAREQWTTRSERPARHDVWREQAQVGSVRRQLLSGRAITLVPERWIGPSGAARHSEPGRQMSSATSMPLLLLPRPRPRSRARCESPALASGVASPLTGVASLPGFSGACERPCRSFHPTAVEGCNGPPASRWVENKFNKINRVRQIEREVSHISLVVLSCCAAARTWHPVRRRSRPAAQNWRATVSAGRPK